MRGYNRCDKCGLFMSPGEVGSSTFFVPDSEFTYEDFGMRCAKCTEEFGEIPPSQGCVQKYCSHTKKAVRKVCEHCGSEDLTFDANARWIVELQDFEYNLIDTVWCNECEDTTTVANKEIKYRKKSTE